MSQSSRQWVGIDLHQRSVVLAVYAGEAKAPSMERRFEPDGGKLGPFLRKLAGRGPVQAVYEAGGCGYWLARRLRGWGVDCDVVAPSLIPQRAGDRVKTDRRDARKLATLHRAGLLECVRVPTEAEERLRALVRAREAAWRDRHRSRQRILKLLQARGTTYPGSKNWTKRHWTWLCGLRLEGDDQVVLDHQLTELELRMELLTRLDGEVDARSRQEPYAGPVSRLRCLRGIDTLSAMTLATEVFDMRRFASAQRFMGWLGFGVIEDSSGGRRRQGRLTRSGNGRCRRILVEAAWNNRHRPHIGADLAKRLEGQPAEVVAHATRAQRRLHRFWTRHTPHKHVNTVVAAMARQLGGFVWALWLAQPEHLRLRTS